MSDIQDRTLWMIEHNIVPTGVHLECARKVFKKARAFDLLKALLTDCNIDMAVCKNTDTKKHYIEINAGYGDVRISITEEEFNILKEVLTDNETNL